MIKRLHVIFHGRVQGVGFRFTAKSVARSLGVVGWVRNLHGGDVEAVGEAEQQVLEDFIRRTEEQFGSYIKNKEVVWETATGEFKGFNINF